MTLYVATEERRALGWLSCSGNISSTIGDPAQFVVSAEAIGGWIPALYL